MDKKQIIKDILSITMLSLMALKSTVFAITPSKDIIENSKNLKELISIYRNNSDYASLSDNDIITKAREDWYEFSKIEAEKAMCFDSLPAEEVTIDEITYRLYGFCHGLTHIPFLTMPKKYRNFVHKAYEIENNKITHSKEISEGLPHSSFIITEQAMSDHIFNDGDDYLIDIRDHLYPEKTNKDDGFIETFILGLIMSMGIPLYKIFEFSSYPLTDIFDALGMEEYRSLKVGFDIQNHSMKIDIQNGLNKKLPSHLEIDSMLSNRKHENSNACTTRSLYMAGFLKGFAENGNYKEIPFFMGLAHLTEVKAFLLDTSGHAEDTEAFKTGKEKGSLLAKNILIAQESSTNDVANVITTWNPKTSLAMLKEIFEFSDAKPSSVLLERPFILGIIVGLAAQISFIYYLYNNVPQPDAP